MGRQVGLDGHTLAAAADTTQQGQAGQKSRQGSSDSVHGSFLLWQPLFVFMNHCNTAGTGFPVKNSVRIVSNQPNIPFLCFRIFQIYQKCLDFFDGIWYRKGTEKGVVGAEMRVRGRQSRCFPWWAEHPVRNQAARLLLYDIAAKGLAFFVAKFPSEKGRM